MMIDLVGINVGLLLRRSQQRHYQAHKTSPNWGEKGCGGVDEVKKFLKL